MSNERSCFTCRWYYEWFGVCCNGYSEYCADCPPDPNQGCEHWAEKEETEQEARDVV